MINTILVTDDNILDNVILRDYLSSGERYNIISAINGREALELVESRNVDLIITDLLMPVMDGFSFIKEFSKTGFFKQIPIIVITSLDDAQNIEKVLQFDIFDYIIKPLRQIDKQILQNKIKSALRYRKALVELEKANKLIVKLSDAAK